MIHLKEAEDLGLKAREPLNTTAEIASPVETVTGLEVKDVIEYDPPTFVKNKEPLEEAVSEAAEEVSKTEDLLLVVLPKRVRAYYVIVKSAASRRGCHTQLVLAPVLQSVLESGKGASVARAVLANISAGVYVEHLIQEEKARGASQAP